MQRQLIVTNDGSPSISVPELHVTYHSIHGAVTESLHVFMDAGWMLARKTFPDERLIILEMGLGTGLNAFLTLIESEKNQVPVSYEAIEQFPLEYEEYSRLHYPSLLDKNQELQFQKIHASPWENEIKLTEYFNLTKRHCSLLDYDTRQKFHLVYFDAFAPLAQPELWSIEVFEKLFSFMNTGGILVTYCSKGDVRRAMIQAGFVVEKLKGPPKKREMLRATR